MWLFISRRLRQWIILSVALPVAAHLAGVLARRLEARSGHPTGLSQALTKVSAFGGRERRRGGRGFSPVRSRSGR